LLRGVRFTVAAMGLRVGLIRFAGPRGKGPHLVVVPKSTLKNWEAEANAWVPKMTYATYDGSPVRHTRCVCVCVCLARVAISLLLSFLPGVPAAHPEF
jgi:hypothetical protein